MYAYKGVSKEEWLFRGLAIAMCLALVGIAVMPSITVGDLLYRITHDSRVAAGGFVAGTLIAYRCVGPAVAGAVATLLAEETLKAALLAIAVGAFGAIVIIGIEVVTAY